MNIIRFSADDVDNSQTIINADKSSCMPSRDNNWCAPRNAPMVKAEIEHNESLGRTCTDTAKLTTFVVFHFRDDKRADTVSFKEAMNLGENGEGWVQAYCA